MNLDGYQFCSNEDSDFRFGKITIFTKTEDQELYFLHEAIYETQQSFDEAERLANDREKRPHFNILQLVRVVPKPEKLTLIRLMKYPNTDLLDEAHVEELQSPVEQVRVIYDMLAALDYLHATGTAHGDLRPEFIYFDQTLRTYILVDRLSNTLPFFEN